MSKKRLKSIKRKTVYLEGTDYLMMAINTDDYRWLIKQAERVQDSENHLKLYEFWYRIAYEQNKRYREALKFYADGSNYVTNIVDDEFNYHTAIFLDNGRIARKALEGEEKNEF